MDNGFYVYEYIRTDKMEPFYIGKGSGNRYLDINKRNEYFKMILSKTKVLVNILHEGLTEEEAFGIECWYINEYKYVYGYNLCNVSDGGDGVKGIKRSLSTREKISIANKGKRLGVKLSEETKTKMSIARKGQKRSEETKAKMSIASTGRVMPKGSDSKNSKRVVCLNTGEVFGSMIEASNKTGITDRMISQCCRGKRKSTTSSDGVKMYWVYESDYNLKTKDEIIDILEDKFKNKVHKKVICLNDNNVFNTITEASKFYNVFGQNISACCKGKIKSIKGLSFKYI